jgi:glycosyltransferase involved in cell wall biosynthesis
LRILYIQYTDPALYPPLEHSSRFFAERGWEVMFLGVGAWGAPEIQFASHRDITVRLLAFRGPGPLQKLHYLVFCSWIVVWIIGWRPKWIYVSDALACPAARLVSWIPGLRTIYHEHDAPGKRDGASALVMRSRTAIARKAYLNVLPNEQRIESFRLETGTERDIKCVWNCPRRDEIAPARPVDSSGDIYILYHGSLVPERLPITVLVSLASLPDNVKLRVIGYETIGSCGYGAILREKAHELKISDRVELLGSMPRSKLFGYARKSDIGLSLMPMTTDDINMRAMTGASNKAFDYLACGLALLVSDLADWRSFFVDPGYALACNPNNATSIVEALGKYVSDPHSLRAMGERGRRRIAAEWNYETQFGPVYEAMEAERA